jgi:hypothetical protein
MQARPVRRTFSITELHWSDIDVVLEKSGTKRWKNGFVLYHCKYLAEKNKTILSTFRA